MTTFLLLYFTIYTLAHYYLIHKARKAGLPVFRSFGLRWESTALPAVLILLLVAAPIIVRIMERSGLETGPKLLAYVSYSWMGLLFLFIALSIFTDLILLLYAFARKTGDNKQKTFKTGRLFVIQIILITGIFCYGFFEARAIRTEHLVIRSPKIPKDRGKIRLVQISDVHLGLILGKKRLKTILDRTLAAEPDLLVATGDLVDSQPDNLEGISRMLAAVQPPLGKLAITGNHEFYAGLDKSLDFTRKAGFQVLRNRSVVLGGISFTGMDDPTAERFSQSRVPEAADLLQGLPSDYFRVLLKHRPAVPETSPGRFDLQLSGHTHKGQIFPFNLITRLFYPRASGLSRTAKGGFLYHSRGTGTWGPPIRFLSPPEVTVIDLISWSNPGMQAVNQAEQNSPVPTPEY